MTKELPPITPDPVEIDGGGDLSNTVTADSAESPSDTDTLNIPISQNAVIHVVKSSTTALVSAAGQQVPYKFTVTNTGNVTLTGITVTDSTCNAAPAYQSGDTNNDTKLQTSETWIYTCTYTPTQADVDGLRAAFMDLAPAFKAYRQERRRAKAAAKSLTTEQ